MSALHAVLRLTWRPLNVLLLGAVGVGAAWSLQEAAGVSEVMPVLLALGLGNAPPGFVVALWQAMAVVAAGLGLIVAAGRIDLQHTTLSWHLPGLRRRLVAATAVLAAAVAFALAALMSRNAPPAATLAGFSLVFYSFLLPGFAFDTAMPPTARLLMALPLAAVVVRPMATAQIAAAYPWWIAAFGLGLGAAQLPAISSERLARLRPFRWSVFHPSPAVYWANRQVRRPDWRGSLATERLVPWLRAAAHESVARYPVSHLQSAAAAVLLARLVDRPTCLPIFAGGILLRAGLQLRSRVVYPLSRDRRAQLAYAGTVVDAAIYFAVLGALLYASSLVAIPRLPFADWQPSRPVDWMLTWACGFALAPIAQWGMLGRSDEEVRRRGTLQAALVAWLIAYFFGVTLVSWLIGRATGGDPGMAAVAAALVALVAQGIHATLVRAQFTTADLVRLPGTR